MQHNRETPASDATSTPPSTAETYLQMYRDQGKQLVIKASGRELAPERLAALVSQINVLTANGIHAILIYGGGDQRREIEDWRGSGTLIFHPRDLSCSPATSAELRIFDALAREYEAEGRFRPRSPEEEELVRREHRIVRIDNSPLGGFSLLDHPSDDCVELAAFWSGYAKNGIGQHIMAHAQRQFAQMGRKRLCALSAPMNPDDPAQHEKLIRLFRGYGFRCRGRTSALQGGTEVPRYVAAYDPVSRGRDPYCFLHERPEESVTP